MYKRQIRAGRANPAILDKVTVDYYGTPTPINQVAAVSVAEARVLTISPWAVSYTHLIRKQSCDCGVGHGLGSVTFSGRYYAAKVYWSGNYCGGRNIVCILGQQITEEEGNR